MGALEEAKSRFSDRLKAGQPLSKFSWLKTGGEADWLFSPASREELADFLQMLPEDIPVFPIGVGSNIIFRDGGVEGVVIRLGGDFMRAEQTGENCMRAGAAMLDAMLARKAASLGIDLAFLRTIPGAIGGAVAMNAGCYGSYIADVLVEIEIMTRDGATQTLPASALEFHYRKTELPGGAIIISAELQGAPGKPSEIEARMDDALAARAQTQPIDALSCGSTFRNPAGHSSTGAAGEDHSLKAWKLIDDAGLRGATRGGAQMSPKHPNFLVNTGGATSFDLEALGEEVRARVLAHSGHELTWEIKRVGRFGAGQNPDWPLEEAD